jgi:hypothetical protein
VAIQAIQNPMRSPTETVGPRELGAPVMSDWG